MYCPLFINIFISPHFHSKLAPFSARNHMFFYFEFTKWAFQTPWVWLNWKYRSRSSNKVYRTSRQGCADRIMMSRHGRPCRVSASASISVSDSKGIPSTASNSQPDTEPAFISQKIPPHFSVSLGIGPSVSYYFKLLVLKFGRKGIEKDKILGNTSQWIQKSSAERRAGPPRKSKYDNRTDFHRTMLAAVCTPADDREQKPHSS